MNGPTALSLVHDWSLCTKLIYVTVSQVVIGGRNKYLINGVNANNTRVQDLFCSVGLNVNNPHFLIMQVGLLSAESSA